MQLSRMALLCEERLSPKERSGLGAGILEFGKENRPRRFGSGAGQVNVLARSPKPCRRVVSLNRTSAKAWAAMTSAIVLSAPLGVRAAGAMRKDWLKRMYAAMLFGIAADTTLRMLG